MHGSIYSNMTECGTELRKQCAEDANRDLVRVKNNIEVDKDLIEDLTTGGPQSAKGRAARLAFTVKKKNNYEGNIICYVDIRTKGTDKSSVVKITFQMNQNRLVIVNWQGETYF